MPEYTQCPADQLQKVLDGDHDWSPEAADRLRRIIQQLREADRAVVEESVEPGVIQIEGDLSYVKRTKPLLRGQARRDAEEANDDR